MESVNQEVEEVVVEEKSKFGWIKNTVLVVGGALLATGAFVLLGGSKTVEDEDCSETDEPLRVELVNETKETVNKEV